MNRSTQLRRPRIVDARTVALATLAAMIQAPLAAQQAEPAARPKFEFLRQREDWARFPTAGDVDDPFDGLKHVKLSSDGDVWVSFGGRVESRIEYWRSFNFGAPPTADHDDSFVVSRGLAHADLHVGDRFRLFVEGKSAQATDRDLPGGRRDLDMDTLDLQQAFADVLLPVGEGTLLLRPGRQMLMFGAQRLISPLPWGNALRTWEGLTAEWRQGPWSVTGIATSFVPVDKTHFNDPDDDVKLYGVYATKAPPKGGHGIDLFVLGSERPAVSLNGTSGDEERTTFGARVFGPAGKGVDYEVEAAWQTGEIGAEDIAAWSIASQVGWKPEGWAGAPRLFLGIDAASGDDTPGGDSKTFYPLFPLGHAYFGYIDAVGRQNVVDASIGGKWALSSATSLSLGVHSLHLMETEDALYNAGGGATRSGFNSREIGTEFDLTVDTRVDRHAAVHAGYSRFFAGDALSETGPSEDIDFVHFGVKYTF